MQNFSRINHETSHHLYYTWNSMFCRCYYPGVNSYETYGGIGITVCKQWRDFHVFLQDMGPRPTGHTLDRINPHGNYTPKNCRWADSKTQSSNKRKRAA